MGKSTRVWKHTGDKPVDPTRRAAHLAALASPIKKSRGHGSRVRIRLLMLEAYGGKCICKGCGEHRPEFMTLDHKLGNGGEERRKFSSQYSFLRDLRDRGWPKDDYRLLCMNCNTSIGDRGYCPHERESHG